MGLVDYSDSEEEGSSPAQPPVPAATKPSASTPNSQAPSKSGFQKVVNPDNTIQVSLPENDTAGEKNGSSAEVDGPPAKRAKTSGAFSGFGSLLPAPKNAGGTKANGNASGGGSLLAQNRGSGLRKGVSLKTGTAPAFSRTRQEEPDEEEAGDGYSGNANASLGARNDSIETSVVPQEKKETPALSEPKLVGKPVVFKPLSVSRKPTRKKPPAAPTTDIAAADEPKRENTATARHSQSALPAASKPKVSLFASAAEEPMVAQPPTNRGEYRPLLDEDENEDEQADVNQIAESTKPQSQTPTLEPPQNDLNTLANTLGLSASERRQLFGRGSNANTAQVSHINMAQEYAHNRELRENEEATPTHNPVRSIAPGKHSLQQLVNAAQSNKDALEESFARGRANKRDAGARYGW